MLEKHISTQIFYFKDKNPPVKSNIKTTHLRISIQKIHKNENRQLNTNISLKSALKKNRENNIPIFRL